MRRSKEQVYGCLIGGAIGDAFGAPVKNMNYEQIQKSYGEQGITDLIATMEGPKATITDDTQLTLFTAEGLLRSVVRANQKGIFRTPKDTAMIVFRAYLRWLYTQGLSTPNWNSKSYDGWLIKSKKLYGYKEPGITCITSLGKGVMGTLERPLNDSKRCGTVIRIAPVGLMEADEDVFEVGSRIGVITHGHPHAYLSSGVLATWIFYLLEGYNLEESLEQATARLKMYAGHEECLEMINKAIKLAKSSKPQPSNLLSFGDGFMADDALAMAIYCALSYPNDFEAAVKLAINQSGNSNSAAAITGQILGVHLGIEAIPSKLIESLEIRKELEQMAQDLYVRYEETEEWQKKYPGW